ncbi:MAG: proteasome activator [Acidimicrobiales bacterium]
MPDTDTPDDDRPVPVVEVIRPDLVEAGTPDGPGADGSGGAEAEEAEEPTEFVSEPAKVMRVGSMIKQLLDEVRTTQLDEPGRERLKAIYDTSITELGSALSPDLRDELNRLALPFDGGDLPSDVELRLAQAQLVGWLEGLFHGIQATLFAQQMAARQQLENMRGQLPPGTGIGPGGGPVEERPGTYL